MGVPSSPTLFVSPQEFFCQSGEGRPLSKTGTVTDRPSCLTSVCGPWGAWAPNPYPRPCPAAPTFSPGLHHGTGGLTLSLFPLVSLKSQLSRGESGSLTVLVCGCFQC